MNEKISLSSQDEISTNVCRICLCQKNILKSMFHCSVGLQSYAEIYESCFGFKILDNPELPNRICNDCESKLIEINNFRGTVFEVERRISAFLSSKNEATELSAKNVPDIAESSDEECYTVEQIYEEEFLIETTEDLIENTVEIIEEIVGSSEQMIESSEPQEPSCKFILSAENPKNIKCKTCEVDCDIEQKINSLKPDHNIPVACECSKVFKNRRSFLKHFSTVHHRRDTKYDCRICSDTFSSIRSRMVHEAKVHSFGLKFTCESCDKKFYRSDHLKEHEKNCSRIVDVSAKFFSCSVCLLPFQREDTYKKHLETAHVGASEDDKECVKRVEEFAKKYSASRNLDDSCEPHGVTCDQCGKIFNNESRLQRHFSAFHTNQFWSCDQCDEVFVHRTTKISHMSKVHGKQKPFVCSITGCSFSCFKRDRFNAHLEKHENPEKKFPCPLCEQEFNSYNTMTLHRAKHRTKNTLECPTCSRQFLDKRNFNVHIKLHTGENLFHCSTCNRGFNRKDHLQKHQKRKNHF